VTSEASLQVRFYANHLPLGSADDTPYKFTWVGVPPGIYSVVAVATDKDGGDATSAPVVITVK